MNRQTVLGIAQKILLMTCLLFAVWLGTSYDSQVRKTVFLRQVATPEPFLKGDIVDLEEYAVYSAVIEHQYGSYRLDFFLIEKLTDYHLERFLRFPEASPDEPWWDDFSVKNQTISSLGHWFKLGKPYLLVDGDLDQKAKLNAQLDAWDVHTSCFLQFSRVGFNPAKDEAVVRVSCTRILGVRKPYTVFATGQSAFLKKVGQNWIVIKELSSFKT